MKNRRVLLWVPLMLFALSCQKENPDTRADAETPVSTPASSGLEVKDRLGPGKEVPHLAVADQLGNRYDLYNLLSKPKNVVLDRKSTRLNSSHIQKSRMPSSA